MLNRTEKSFQYLTYIPISVGVRRCTSVYVWTANKVRITMDFHNSAVRIKHDVTFKDIVDMPDMPAKTVSSSHLHLTLCCVLASLGERCGCGSDITGHHWTSLAPGHLGTWCQLGTWALPWNGIWTCGCDRGDEAVPRHPKGS